MSNFEFKLSDNVMYVKGVGPRRAAALKKLNVLTMYDLLTHYPRTYENHTELTKIGDIIEGETVLIIGQIYNLTSRTTANGLHLISAYLFDETGCVRLTWFNQEYLLKMLHNGLRLLVIGKAKFDRWANGLTISQMQSFTVLEQDEEPELGIMPIYPATAALRQKALRTAIKNLLNKLPPLKEILPQKIIDTHNLMPLDRAARAIHFPKDFAELEAAKRRLAFDELFLIQCGLLFIKRQTRDERQGITHAANGMMINAALSKLPFKLTGDQLKIFAEVSRDMEGRLPMRRLIQGDVGSGKTVIALLALVKTVENGFQGAFMAPTEILANQHYEKFSALLTGLGIRVGLLSATVTRTKKLREDLYRKIATHEFDIIIGTHALIQEGVTFAKLGLVITDEQHRFGVSQRSSLEKKSDIVPDMLVMTATPIPRTMILTIYGDLDVSFIKELPPGRKPIKTAVAKIAERDAVYKFAHKEIAAGKQAYVVCPLIERSESDQLAEIESAEEIFDSLSNGIFRDVPCALLHGKMKPRDKDDIMEKFRSGETKLLVATTVIEVGVDVPNASVMVVEHAERFGLAQLHQLRGRVGRGGESSYCILISDGRADVANTRLEILESTNDGSKLAEEDLKLRGPGHFFGEAQHGLPDLKIADVFRDMELLIQARTAAEEFVNSDNTAATFAELKKILSLAYGDKFNQITEA